MTPPNLNLTFNRSPRQIHSTRIQRRSLQRFTAQDSIQSRPSHPLTFRYEGRGTPSQKHRGRSHITNAKIQIPSELHVPYHLVHVYIPTGAESGKRTRGSVNLGKEEVLYIAIEIQNFITFNSTLVYPIWQTTPGFLPIKMLVRGRYIQLG